MAVGTCDGGRLDRGITNEWYHPFIRALVTVVRIPSAGGPMTWYENLVETGRLRADSHQKGQLPLSSDVKE